VEVFGAHKKVKRVKPETHNITDIIQKKSFLELEEKKRERERKTFIGETTNGSQMFRVKKNKDSENANR
jgi:hypothetical protein